MPTFSKRWIVMRLTVATRQLSFGGTAYALPTPPPDRDRFLLSSLWSTQRRVDLLLKA
jgi:hypothetical protein